MRNVLAHYTTVIWLILVTMTALSWWLGEHNMTLVNQHLTAPAVTTIMLVVSFFKVRLVGLHFMELRHAPLPLRLIFEAWVWGVGAALLIMYWN